MAPTKEIDATGVIELSPGQLRTVLDAQQLFDAWAAALTRLEGYRGGMHWKSVGGRQYLFRARDRRGNGTSLGQRNAETEKTLERFRQGKAESKARESALRGRLSEQARYCKAARVNRVPRLAAAIARALWRASLNRAVLIVGTNCIYAYEAACGVAVADPGRLETLDLDLLLDSRRSIALTGNGLGRDGLLGVLRKVDRSFELTGPRSYRAVNQDGYMVELIGPTPKPPWQDRPESLGDESELRAADVRNLDWYLAAPRLRQIVIGDDGFPAPFTVPDPRVFALHKLWLSRQPDRDPLKRPRDRLQALWVAHLTARHLPHLSFAANDLRMLPLDVARLVDELELPPEGSSRPVTPVGFESPEDN